jgi:sensor c-di-GMP phosphodiesterase-like protein
MRTLQQRVWIAVALSVFGTLGGALGGYLLGRATALGQTEIRLAQSANRIMNDGDAGTAESRRILAKMNSSSFPFCSENEIAYFRRLVFQSRFLKDAGRIRDGQIECSTTLGHPASSFERLKPDFTQNDGTILYQDLPMFRIGTGPSLTVQLADSYIVYGLYDPTVQIAPSVHYTGTDVDVLTRTAGHLFGDAPHVPLSILTVDGKARLDGTMYATHCSTDHAFCITTYMSIEDALLANRTTLGVALMLGAIAGGLLGFVCSLIYGRNHGMEYRLLRAIRRDQLRVVYQPIVDLQTGNIVEAEALARWTDDDNVPISPDVFIRAAEKAGFVGEITKLIVRHVVREFGKTLRDCPGFRVNVNIAAPDLADPEFMPMLDRALSAAGIYPSSLGIEITESFTARQQVAKETILRLRERGHVVHIDDFGTGYSSLAYLHDLSVDAIKIDKVFTKAIGTDAVTISILPQILTMADTLDLRVVVEGIETPQQAAYFAAADQSIYAQGWLFGHPVSADSFHRLLGERTAAASRLEPLEHEARVTSAHTA